MLATLRACGNGLASASNAGRNHFRRLEAAESGLDRGHGFQLSTWLNNTRRQEDYLNSGGLAVGDLDRDCWNDVLLAGGLVRASPSRPDRREPAQGGRADSHSLSRRCCIPAYAVR